MRRATLQNTFTRGVLDPSLSERRDLAHYESGLQDAVNLECIPQGAVRRRAGTSLREGYSRRGMSHRLRRRLRPVHVTSAMLTAHNGGMKANLVDQSVSTVFTTSAVGASTFVVIEIDLGVARPITFVDLIGFSCATGRFESVVAVEWWDGAAWIGMAGAGDPNVSPRLGLRSGVESTYRFGEWPGGPNGTVVTARSWRVTLYSAIGAGAISVRGLRFWEEARAVSPVRILSFARASDVVYELVLTERNIDVFRDHQYQASIAVPVAAHQVEEVTFEQSLDTLFIFHEDVETVQVTRRGAHKEWNAEPAAWTDIPALTPGTAFSGDQDEIQLVGVGGLSAGRQFVLWVGDDVTAPITYASATLASDIATALGAIPAIGAPPSVVLQSGADPTVRVSFVGGLGARRWPAIDVVALDDDPTDFWRGTVQRGLLSTGPTWGKTTGYPRCGARTQSRFVLAGFRAAPQSIVMSRVGSFSFLNEATPITADLGMVLTLDTDALETIHQIVIGRHMQLFTDSSEWYIEARTIDATQPPNVLKATGFGIRDAVRAQFSDGATYFIQKGGRVTRGFLFSDAELSYKAEPVSLLSPHLLTDVVDMAARSARSTDEGNQLFMVNRDGDVVFASILRDQQVIAFTQWLAAEGAVRSVAGDALLRVWLAVERASGDDGEPDLMLERLDDRHTLDAAVRYYREGVATRTIDGLAVHEGRTVWVWADGDLVGPFVVDGGTVSLADPVSEAVVGLMSPLYGELLPIRPRLEEQQFRPPARIYEVELALGATGAIEIATGDGLFRPVKLDLRQIDINRPLVRSAEGLGDSSAIDGLEALVRALCVIPATGEHVLASEAVTDGAGASVNTFDDTMAPTVAASLGQARQAFPRLSNISLFVSWFGDDLRCAMTALKPKTDNAGKTTSQAWSVSGVTRETAGVISTSGGGPAYGGTPGDLSVVQAIQLARDHRLSITMLPFILMDVPASNGLPDPYGGLEQAAYPWRGRITCHPAPGVAGTVDMTASAATQVATFMGAAEPDNFQIVGETVVYTGPAEWSYRRFILHYASLCKAAGGVDAFVIGSEMRGLEFVRSALGVYPFVDALVVLAADVRAILGAGTKITYAADWSSVTGHQTAVAGERFNHLDPLWSSPVIDAIGVDNYWPLADWRDGSGHADWVEGFRSAYDRAYLRRGIAGGEGYDWYYATIGDRDAQTRTSITDGAYGEPWVWRFKDIASWWSNAHHDRPAGGRSGAATAWVPKSKPIWFLEAGCPAVDKGANQPNVFYDPKSSESFFPYYSRGNRDDRAQRAYLEALLSWYDPTQLGFSDAQNPPSPLYDGRMVDHERVYVYAWDARHYPTFPDLAEVYADASLWKTGHWLTGRMRIPSVLDDVVPVGTDPDLPLIQRLLTGNVRVTNMQGWSRHPRLRFRQSKPAPLEIRAIRMEVAYG